MIYVDYCHLEELEVFNPELAERVSSSRPTERMPLITPPFVYALRQSGYVLRVAVKDYKMGGFRHDLTESAGFAERMAMAKKQQRLDERGG